MENFSTKKKNEEEEFTFVVIELGERLQFTTKILWRKKCHFD